MAIGAVIEEVIPAQNNPIEIKYFEKDPKVGDNWLPRSTAFFISFWLIDICEEASVIIIYNDIIPPITIDITVSNTDDL